MLPIIKGFFMTCTVFATESDFGEIEKIDDVISVNLCKENGDIYPLRFTMMVNANILCE